jgi:hypothetical protein
MISGPMLSPCATVIGILWLTIGINYHTSAIQVGQRATNCYQRIPKVTGRSVVGVSLV